MDMSIPSHWELSGNGDSIVDAETPSGCAIVLQDFLVENYDRLYRRLAYYLGCSDQASDCLHDAWLRLGEMDIPVTVSHPEAYVYRVACNLALDRLRSSRPWQSLADFEELETIVDPVPGPDQIAEARSELAAVERAIQSLPHRCLSVLFDLRINELTRQEVAIRHGLSLRRVDTLLRQTLDYCAELSNQPVLARRQGSRRPLRVPLLAELPLFS